MRLEDIKPTDTLFGNRYCHNHTMHKPECDCARKDLEKYLISQGLNPDGRL